MEDRQDANVAKLEIIRASLGVDTVEVYFQQALPVLLNVLGGDFIGCVEPASGRWNVLGEFGKPQAIPESHLGEVLDRGEAVVAAGWTLFPIVPRGSGPVLAVHGSTKSQPAVLAELAAAVRVSIDSVRGRSGQTRRIRRLEAILEIAQQWNRTKEMEPLLVEMAEAATRLLDADRASIFLWDKPDKVLVGRPALGVEGNELRIGDDVGVVGQVVRTGQPRRIDRSFDQDQIGRQVDELLNYQTHNLLCVPLRSVEGEMLGAFEVINKRGTGDFTNEDQEGLIELAGHAAVALENTQERQQLLATHRQMTEEATQGAQLIGESPAIDALRSTIRRVADTDLALLVLGENGTGKEVVARLTHYLGRRRDQPLIAVNCAAISETLLESELFGHEQGAFTDAREARAGKFELASGGTLFLDEIGDLSPGGQAKLLRVLEEKVVVRVGGSTPIHTDARVIAATNQDLSQMVREKKFREDLFFRLNVVTIELPPLRDRPQDVLLLARHFLRDFAIKARRKELTLSEGAERRLTMHAWPGNVRELRNVMERVAYLTQSDIVEPEELVLSRSTKEEGEGWVPLDLTLADATGMFQSEYIRKAIGRSEHNMSEAAKQLGLHRSNLYRKMRQLGMSDDEATGTR